ncbi:hypothetical protein B566_EDAN005379 [Ephemera danica]|nr:hypothetical protein B566_EDAN005379 [Ephemera danica]
MNKKFEAIVADTAAFIKNASLQDLAENVYTVQSVVDEVTSKRQLKNLVVLPYQLKIKDAFPENIKFITEFSKKTGDYPSLSATDIQVLALTYELEKQIVGNEHLKTEPTMGSDKETGEQEPEEGETETAIEMENAADIETSDAPEIEEEEETPTDNEVESEPAEAEDLQEGPTLSDIEYSDEESEDEGADVGWITPQNIAQVKQRMGGSEVTENPPAVACITSDFAMQNVLRQIGLQVISADGKLIKHVRTYILRCYACFKTTSVMTKVFCPKCGNQTLKRVAVTLNEDGSLKMHFSRKHANNDIRFEDQPIPQQRPTRLARVKNNPLDPDYIAGFSPFVTRDTNSRAAMLGINSNWSSRGTSRGRGNKRGKRK